MRFPTVGEIATTSVVMVHKSSSLLEVIDVMCEHGHRNVVVVDGCCFYLLGVNDVLNKKIQNSTLNVPVGSLELNKIPSVYKNENILSTIEYLNCNVEHICAINEDGTIYGLLTHTDITSSIDPETLMNNFCLNEFLKLGKRVKWIAKEKKTLEVLADMINNSADSVMIVENQKPIGIFTTKDIVKIIRKDLDLEVPISAYMSSPVDVLNRESSVKEALDFLTSKHYKRVVVVDENGCLSGMITQKELISLAYSKWAMLTKEYQDELSKINESLIKKNTQIEHLASRDPLTNLYNRYKFSKLFDISLQAMNERESEVSLVMADIDFFKKVNDTYGHGVGDKVLVAISELFLALLREEDIVCRWGGEEFVILLLSTNLQKALSISQKLREHVETMEIEPVHKVTASFGVTQIRVDDDLKSAVDRADSALYMAKKAGRNCVKHH
ncbi:MAG: diguanylate cyclase [Sulfurimonas sp.]|jgi:diguanylate cyclase (GGDEF)-like protein